MLSGFKDFVLRGNVVDLAVAVVIGAAFTQVVNAVADDVIGGLIGAVGGTPDFGDAAIALGDGRVVYGTTITAAVQFLIVAAVVYVLVVTPLNRLAALRRSGAEPEPEAEVSEEVRLLREIRDELRAARGEAPSAGPPGSA